MRGEISERTAAGLERDLAACAGVGVTVTVNSQGGDLLAGIAIAKAIKEHGQVTAILKRADSAALAFCAAKQVRAVEGQEYLLHNPTIQIPHSVAVSGPEMHASADTLAHNFTTFSRCFDKRISDGLFRLLADSDRRLTAAEMVTYGLADEVTKAPALAPDDDENDEAGDISEEEIAAAVRAGIKRQLDAWKR